MTKQPPNWITKYKFPTNVDTKPIPKNKNIRKIDDDPPLIPRQTQDELIKALIEKITITSLIKPKLPKSSIHGYGLKPSFVGLDFSREIKTYDDLKKLYISEMSKPKFSDKDKISFLIYRLERLKSDLIAVEQKEVKKSDEIGYKPLTKEMKVIKKALNFIDETFKYLKEGKGA